jgi:putative ABC transport system permease protein
MPGIADFRHGVRMLFKHPGLAAIAIVALALGIGLTATMWSIVWGGILRGLPFEEAERIVHLERSRPSHDIESYGVPASDFAAWQAEARSFEQLGAYSEGTVNVSGGEGRPERFEGGFVTPEVFPLLRVAPLMGRTFTADEARPGAAPVAILGWGIWQSRFGGDPEIIGKTIRANGVAREIIGVMPRGFLFPTNAALWLPKVVDPLAQPWGQGDQFEVVGRLKPGVTREKALEDIGAIAARLATEHPKENDGVTPIVQPFTDEYVGREPKIMLWTMLAAVFGVFLIACSNVANLLLARAAVRTREVAIRTALGASRWRIVTQHLTEALVLSTVGAVLGTGIAWYGCRAFMDAIRDTEPPFWIDIRLDGAVLGFTLGITLLAALVSGLVPAIQATRSNLHDVLKDEARGSSSLRLGRFSRSLVMVELALAGGLLVAAGFMIQSVVQRARFDYGVPTENVFIARVGLFESTYPDTASRQRFWAELDRRLEDLPGSTGSALMVNPPGLWGWRQRLGIEGATYKEERDYPETRQVAVTPRYFTMFGVAPLEGRALGPEDQAGGLPVAVVSRNFARTHFGDASPLGRRIRIGTSESREPWLTIVGVVPDIWYEGNDDDPIGTVVFTPVAQGDYRFLTLGMTTTGNPRQLHKAVEAVVSGIDPDQPIYFVRTLEEALYQSGWFYSVFGVLFMAFGGAALFLATVGVYGVVSFGVAQRTREVGVRMALGASPRDVLGMFLRQGGVQVAVGLAVGLLLAFFLGKGLALVLFQVDTTNPLMYAGVNLVLALTCLVAIFLPARRALRVDPIVALRYE